MQITVVDHPLAAVRLTALRAEATDNASFRAALKELTQMLVYEAMREAAVAPVTVTTPLEDTDGAALAAPPRIDVEGERSARSTPRGDQLNL